MGHPLVVAMPPHTAVARQLGLTARHAAQGVAALPAMLWNGPVDAINVLAGTRIPRADIAPALDAIGLPRADTPTERIAQDVVEAIAGTGGAVKLARVATAGMQAPLARGISALFADRPGVQLASAAGSAGAAGVARENDIGAIGQTLAALGGGLAPAAVGVIGPMTSMARRATEQAKLAQTGIGPWGPVYGRLAGDPENAVAHLLNMRTGEVPRALTHPDIPGERIGLVYGQVPGSGASGHGVAKLGDKHPETLADLQRFLSSMGIDVSRSGTNRIRLTDGRGKQGVVSLNRYDQPTDPWLMTAYQKQSPALSDRALASGKSMDTTGLSREGDTALFAGNMSIDEFLRRNPGARDPRRYVGIDSPEQAAVKNAIAVQALRDVVTRALSGTALGQAITAP